ncbi:MAG: hypothetical protein PHP65_01520, partial [Bacilli bacterium]|nr:hypothetical protein [Bacilli bacterium]
STNPLFSIYLPSILGESFIIWGVSFYWLHAFLLGIMTGTTGLLLTKYRQLLFYSFFIVFRALAIGRAGSQGYISLIINGSLLLIVLFIFLSFSNAKEKKTVVYE